MRTGKLLIVIGRFLPPALRFSSPMRPLSGGIPFRLWLKRISLNLFFARCLGRLLLLSLAADFADHVLQDVWWTDAALSRMRREAGELQAITQWISTTWYQNGGDMQEVPWGRKSAFDAARRGSGRKSGPYLPCAAISGDDRSHSTLPPQVAPRASTGRQEREYEHYR